MPRAPKKCARDGCEERVVAKPYCPSHQAERERRRNTTQRGYGWAHQQARAAAISSLLPNQICGRCGQPLLPGQPLALDHTDDRTGYRGLAHRRCNDLAGAQRSGRRDPPPPRRS